MIQPKGRPESDREYAERCQEELDRAQWRGVGLESYPERGVIHEYDPDDTPHIYKRKKE